MPKRQKDDERPSGKKRLRSGKTVEAAEVVQLGDNGGQGGHSKEQTSSPTGNPNRNVPAISEFVDFGKVLAQTDMLPSHEASEVDASPRNDSATPPAVAFTGGEEIMRLGSEDLSSHVPNQICKKIWAHEYININLLLKGNVELHEFCSGGVLHMTEKGQVESRPKVVKDKVASIEKWTDAFLIFASIYLKKFPGKLQEILQYMNIIREAASRSFSFSWRTYDEQFRARQESHVQSWARIHSDLWLRVMTTNTYPNTNTYPTHTESAYGQRAYCLDFNNGFCSFHPCKFTHACSNCGGLNHGRQSCFKLTSTNNVSANRGTSNFRPYRGQSQQPRGRGRHFNRRGGRF